MRYLISEKSGITDSINHNFKRIRIDSYNSLPIEKKIDFYKVKILIKSVVNKNKNNYYCKYFFRKRFNEHKSYTQCFEMSVCIL